MDYSLMSGQEVKSIIESLKPSHSVVLSREDYYKIKEYAKRFCVSTSEYREDNGREYKESLFFICNKILFVLIYIRLFYTKEEIYSLYRPL